MKGDIELDRVQLPLPLSVVKKPGARSSYFLAGPLGRNVALSWSSGEAAALVKTANAYPKLLAALARCRAALRANGAPNCEAMKESQAILTELGEPG